MAPSGVQHLETNIIIVDRFSVCIGILEVRILPDETMSYKPNH